MPRCVWYHAEMTIRRSLSIPITQLLILFQNPVCEFYFFLFELLGNGLIYTKNTFLTIEGFMADES